MSQLLGNCEQFALQVSAGLKKLGISRAELAMMDHICYRVETQDRYIELKDQFLEIAEIIGENLISGRKISTFEFKDYLHADGWTIPYLELPAPKEGSPYPEGLEHVELVVIGDLERFALIHSSLPFDRGGMSKTINPELGLKVDGISVKFHEQPLGAVVRIENRLAELAR